MTDTLSARKTVRVRPLGGPTVLLHYAGLRLLTDPTFDPPGEYQVGRGYSLVKTEGPSTGTAELGAVDIVLLSHDQHADNLDHAGRAYLADVPRVLTTVSAAARLGNGATPMQPWSQLDLPLPEDGSLSITAVPARHGPEGTEGVMGEVTGFVLRATGLPSVYISGDNASLDVVREIVERLGTVDLAVPFAGGAQTPALGDAFLTLTSEDAAEAATILGADRVVPAHFAGWQHFSQDGDSLRAAFARAGIGDRLVLLAPGQEATWPDA